MTPRASWNSRATRTVALMGALVLSACGSADDFIGRPELSTYLARVTIDERIAEYMEGSPPAPGSGPTANIPGVNRTITGGSTQLEMSGSAPYQTVVVYVDGVEGYYLVTLEGPTTLSDLILTIGGRPPALDFNYVVAVAGPDGVFGPHRAASVEAIEVAGGDIQVSVAWNTLADVDVHVIDPNGEEIYFGNRNSGSGGELDLDANAACSVSSIFQENVGWEINSAPNGQYTVRVEYWDACGAATTDYVVTVSLRPGLPVIPGTPGTSVQTFTGTFTGPGSQGGAGSGRLITNFSF